MFDSTLLTQIKVCPICRSSLNCISIDDIGFPSTRFRCTTCDLCVVDYELSIYGDRFDWNFLVNGIHFDITVFNI